MRVAVRLGGRRPLLALAEGEHGVRRLVPHACAPTPRTADPLAEAAAALRAVLGAAAADELLLVHPAHWSGIAVRRVVERLGPLAAVVRACPEPVALLRELDARALLAPGPLAVLTEDAAGIGVRVFDDVTAGGLLAARLLPTGPDPTRVPGELVTQLLASVTSGAGLDPTELTGGVLLCWSGIEDGSGEPPRELLAALGELVGEPPRVLEDPGVAAVLGALRPAPRGWLGAGAPRGAAGRTAERWASAAWGDRVGRGLLGEPPARHWARAVLFLAGVPLLAAALTLLAGSGRARPPEREGPPARTDLTQHDLTPDDLAQYDYALRLPAGWRHSGGLPERRRTLLAPADRPDGSDLISIEQRVLGYDATREPERALAELRAEYQRARAGGAALSGLAPSVRFAGRDVAAYHQHQAGRDTDVDWYVVFARGVQLSVGCQHTRAGAASVGSACATVLRTLRPTN